MCCTSSNSLSSNQLDPPAALNTPRLTSSSVRAPASSPSEAITHEAAIRAEARQLGFEACGFCAATAPEGARHLPGWLARQFHGEMAWLARNVEKRANPQLVLPGARSLVVVALNYGDAADHSDQAHPAESSQGRVSRYARHADYHEVMGPRLAALAEFINQLDPPATRSLWYVDTGPVLEKALAEQAGLGFIGKHTNLVSRKLGNWVLLGEVLTTLPLAPDRPAKNRCGSCSRCLEACPTQALIAPFQLDARLCVSYLTIELKGPIPLPLRPLIGTRIFGCDDCLAACPWNRFAQEGAIMRQFARPDLEVPDLIEWLSLDEAAFRARFAGTPLFRTKRRGVLRNVCVALGNAGGEESLPALRRASADAEPLIAEHAQWALGQVQRRLGRQN